jgi:pimeloyl-ACP methyl ester carboxylesterase
MNAEQSVRLPDSRRVAYGDYGEPGGNPLIVLHGTPGSRLLEGCLDKAARAAGVRLIAPDRPGFGGSDPAPRTGCDTYTSDIVSLASALGLDRFAVAGVSGGGAYALACGALLPDRVEKVILISAMLPAPRSALAGQAAQVRLVFTLAQYAPGLAKRLLARNSRVQPAQLARSLPAADRWVASDPHLVDGLLADAREGLRQGPDACVAELARYGRPLPFDIAAVRVPVRIVHGSADRNVPVGVARWARDRLRDATLRVIDGGGHMFALRDPDEVFSQLA